MSLPAPDVLTGWMRNEREVAEGEASGNIRG